MANEIKKYLDHAGLTAYDEKIKKVISDGDAETLQSAKDYADGLSGNYESAGAVATAIENLKNNEIKANADAVAEVKEDVGTLDNLGTTAKTDLVAAINEVRNSVSAGGTAAAVTMDTNTTTEGALKSYTIKQGDNVVGVIDIPKDMVVESGEVVVDPEGQASGTYIKLVLANVVEPLYINVGTLVDIYKAKAGATQVQVAIDSSTREISASIVAGSVGATELAANAVTTEKIADANVTKAKLSNEVQTSLGKADAAAPQTALDTEVAKTEAMDTRLKAVETLVGDGGSVDEKIATAESNAKAYTDTLKSDLTSGSVTVRKATTANHAILADEAAVAEQDLDGNVIHETYETKTDASSKLAEAKAYADNLVAEFTPITTDEINALFA